MKIRIDDQLFRFAPDEPPAGEADGESTAPSLPDSFEIDGEQVDRETVLGTFRNRRKMDSEAHKRNEEINRQRSALQQEQEAWRQTLASQQGDRQAFLEALREQRSPAAPEAPDAPVSVRALIQERKLDLVGDENAPDTLAELLDTAVEAREQRLTRSFEQRLQERENALRQDLSQRFEGRLQSSEQRTARERALEAAERTNRELFDKRMRAEHGKLLERLDDEGREAVYTEMRSLIDNRYGHMNNNAQWLWNEAAVDRAVRSAEPTFNLLMAEAKGHARREGLEARLRGEDASRSTPTRTQRTTRVSGDDALIERYNHVNQAFARREIGAEQAVGAFTPEERARIRILQGGG